MPREIARWNIDLHAKNSYLAIIDEQRQRIFKRYVTNDRQIILSFLAAYTTELAGIVVGSTFEWYWLVDTLQVEHRQVCATLKGISFAMLFQAVRELTKGRSKAR